MTIADLLNDADFDDFDDDIIVNTTSPLKFGSHKPQSDAPKHGDTQHPQAQAGIVEKQLRQKWIPFPREWDCCTPYPGKKGNAVIYIVSLHRP